jgi:hypothetical protein
MVVEMRSLGIHVGIGPDCEVVTALSMFRPSEGTADYIYSMRAFRPVTPGEPLQLEIGRAILVHEPTVGVGAHHVDVGTGGKILRLTRTNFEINRRRTGSVDHVMAIAGAFWKGRAVAGAQYRLTAVLDQC